MAKKKKYIQTYVDTDSSIDSSAEFESPESGGAKSESTASESPRLFWPMYYPDKNGNIKQHEDISEFPEFGIVESSLVNLNDWHNKEEERINQKSAKAALFEGQDCPGIDFFWNKLLRSHNIILIDGYFSVTEWNKLIFELRKNIQNETVREIKILCKENPPFSKDVFNKLQEELSANILVCSISNWKDECPIHDRFAILDGKIWHFGCTVGGAYHRVNAFSGEWKDKNGKFREYVENLIQIHGKSSTEKETKHSKK